MKLIGAQNLAESIERETTRPKEHIGQQDQKSKKYNQIVFLIGRRKKCQSKKLSDNRDRFTQLHKRGSSTYPIPISV